MGKHWSISTLVGEDKFKLSSMFPCPLLLDTRFFLFRIHSHPLFFLNCLNIISKPTHEYILFSSLEFCRPKVEEGAPKNCRNGRHQENIEIKTDSYHAFLHVPVPTGLRYSFFLFLAYTLKTSSSKPTQVHFILFTGPILQVRGGGRST